jgi:hypothetical protein
MIGRKTRSDSQSVSFAVARPVEPVATATQLTICRPLRGCPLVDRGHGKSLLLAVFKRGRLVQSDESALLAEKRVTDDPTRLSAVRESLDFWAGSQQLQADDKVSKFTGRLPRVGLTDRASARGAPGVKSGDSTRIIVRFPRIPVHYSREPKRCTSPRAHSVEQRSDAQRPGTSAPREATAATWACTTPPPRPVPLKPQPGGGTDPPIALGRRANVYGAKRRGNRAGNRREGAGRAARRPGPSFMRPLRARQSTVRGKPRARLTIVSRKEAAPARTPGPGRLATGANVLRRDLPDTANPRSRATRGAIGRSLYKRARHRACDVP